MVCIAWTLFLVVLVLTLIGVLPLVLIVNYCIWSLHHPVWIIALLSAAVWSCAIRSLLGVK